MKIHRYPIWARRCPALYRKEKNVSVTI